MTARRSRPQERASSDDRRPTTLRRAEITEAALRIIASRGIAALNTRALAAEVGLSSGAIFRHFPSIAAVLDGAVAQVETLLDATYPPTALPPRDRLLRFIETRSKTVGSQEGILRLLLSDQFLLALPEEGAGRLRRCVDKTKQFILECIRQGQKTQAVRDDVDAEVLTAIVMGTVQMLALATANSPQQHHVLADKAQSVREGLGKLLDPVGEQGSGGAVK